MYVCVLLLCVCALRVVCCLAFGVRYLLFLVCSVLLGVCCLMQCFAISRLLWIEMCSFFVVLVLLWRLLFVMCCSLLVVVCVCCLLVIGVFCVVGVGALCFVVS